jgi:hypothetical protein
MSDTDKFRDRALDVIEEVFGGEHHVFHLKWEGDGCKFLVNEQMATYDFSDLTRLVVACHDHCVRGGDSKRRAAHAPGDTVAARAHPQTPGLLRTPDTGTAYCTPTK